MELLSYVKKRWKMTQNLFNFEITIKLFEKVVENDEQSV
jgi:hypothetical protein